MVKLTSSGSPGNIVGTNEGDENGLNHRHENGAPNALIKFFLVDCFSHDDCSFLIFSIPFFFKKKVKKRGIVRKVH